MLASTRARALASSSRARSRARLGVADLDLQALAGAGLLGDRPEGLEGARLLLDLEGRRVAQRRQRLARLLADEAVELGGELVHPRDVGLLAGEQVLGRGQVVEPERAELLVGVGLGLAQLGLHLGAAAQPAVDLDVAELALHPVAPAQPERDERRG